MARVELEGVDKRYDGSSELALQDVSLTVEDGEAFALLGPSGCGKSTLLKILGGLEMPTEGDVCFDGELVNFQTARERNVAMVFQNYALYPHMTARQNIAFPLKMRKEPKRTSAAEVERVSDVLRLARLLDRKVSELSGGERQRVALARAMVRRPAVTLMDEPLSNLDAQLRVQTREELIRIHREVPGTLIYVTHDQVEAMTLGERIGIMNQGRLVQVGRPSEIYALPADRFVAGFIGSPSMSFVDAQVRGGDEGAAEAVADGLRLELPARAAATAAGRGTLCVGVRPEAVTLGPPAGEPTTWEIELIEDLGAERIVSVVRGPNRLRTRLGFRELSGVAVGDRVAVRLDAELIHYFGPDGRRIDVPAEGGSAPLAVASGA
jgi:ABC-type sugar transport system ATPase subunit